MKTIWLNDYAMFMAIKERFKAKALTTGQKT